MRRPKRRSLLAFAGVAVIAAAVMVGLPDAGEESPEAAIYEIAHEVEHRDAEGVCDRLLPASKLPAPVASGLGLVRAGEKMEVPSSECANDLGERAFRLFALGDPRVRKVADVVVESSNGITRGAIATVEFGRGKRRELRLVQYYGRWRLVLTLDEPSRRVPITVQRQVHGVYHRLGRHCNRRETHGTELDRITSDFVRWYRAYPAARYALQIDDESGTMLSAILVLRYELSRCSPRHAARIDAVLPARMLPGLRPLPRGIRRPSRASGR